MHGMESEGSGSLEAHSGTHCRHTLSASPLLQEDQETDKYKYMCVTLCVVLDRPIQVPRRVQVLPEVISSLGL